MRPTEDRYQRHKLILEEVMKSRMQEEVKMVGWVVKCAINREEHSKQRQGEMGRETVSMRPEKTMEMKILHKYSQ